MKDVDMEVFENSRTETDYQKLMEENETLRLKLSEAEETLFAIQSGAVDAVVVRTNEGDQIFTLEGADYSYRIFVETMDEGAATITSDHHVMYCNRRLSEILNTPTEKIIGNSINKFIEDEDVPVFESIIAKGLKESSRGEIRFNTGDSGKIPVLVSCTPINLDVKGVCLIFTELTELKNAQEELRKINDDLEETVIRRTRELTESNQLLRREVEERLLVENALRESEKKYRELVIHAPTGIYEIDFKNRKFISVNDSMCHLLGYSMEELLSLDPFDIMEENSKVIFQKRIDQVMCGEKPEENPEYKVFAKNGREIYAVLNVTFTMDDTGKYKRATVIGHDITERKKFEQALQQSEEKYRKLVEKLNLALDSGAIGTWEWNLSTNEVLWDERLEEMFGLKKGSFDQTYDSFEKFLTQDDIPRIQRTINKTIEENIPFETIYQVSLNNGESKFINSKGIVEKDENGNPQKMIGVCFDITEMKKGAEKALFKVNEELLRSNKELAQFAYVASHDLQEPLRMVSSFTQLLAQRYKDKLDDNAQEFINFAVEGATRMQKLINDLLAYSRIQTRGQEFKEVDMNVVVERVVKNFSLRINELKASITHDKLPVITADEGQMGQLLQNLIGNALKFCINIPVIHVSSKEEDDYFIFSIKDNGIGIESQYFERIFQIFQRLCLKEEYEGTGIGLSISKNIVERHGGKIWLESELGVGTTFYFSVLRTHKHY